MKLLISEFDTYDYQNYRFPYCIHAVKEEGDTYHDLYSKGFLPYSNDLKIKDEIFYLARSIRIPLQGKIFNYKQQNVLNKFSSIFSDQDIHFTLTKKENLVKNDDFRKWSINNAKENFLSIERLGYILSRPYLEDILEIKHKNQLLGNIYIIKEHPLFAHIWFSFFDLQIPYNDFGKWIILKTMQWLKEFGFQYFYIGTCYGMNAFYKLTLSPQTTFFDGMQWNDNISALKKQLINT